MLDNSEVIDETPKMCVAKESDREEAVIKTSKRLVKSKGNTERAITETKNNKNSKWNLCANDDGDDRD